MSFKILLAVSQALVKIDGTDRERRGATVTLDSEAQTLTFVDNGSTTRLNAVPYTDLGTAANQPFISYDDMAAWVNQYMKFKGITIENLSGALLKIKGRPQTKDSLRVLWDEEPAVEDNSITVLKDGVVVLENVKYDRIFLDSSTTACASYASLITWMQNYGYWKGEYAQTVTATVAQITLTDASANTAFGNVPCSYMDLTNATTVGVEDPVGAGTIWYKRSGSLIAIPIPIDETRRIEGITNANQITIIAPDDGQISAIAEIYTKA